MRKAVHPNSGPFFFELFWLERTDASSFRQNFQESLVKWITPQNHPSIKINGCCSTGKKKKCLALSTIFLPWLLLENTHPEFRNQIYRFLTCSTDGIKKTVIVIGANKSAREHDSMEGNVILCHELMKSDLGHIIP